MLENHHTLTDLEFTRQFEDATLDPAIFTHEAHLRLAWININRAGLNNAIEIIKDQLRNYTKAVGAADKYNATVTVAAIHAVYHFMIRSNCNNFKTFIEENCELKTNFKGLINTHYKTDIFRSETAKVIFLEPELLPFN